MSADIWRQNGDPVEREPDAAGKRMNTQKVDLGNGWTLVPDHGMLEAVDPQGWRTLVHPDLEPLLRDLAARLAQCDKCHAPHVNA